MVDTKHLQTEGDPDLNDLTSYNQILIEDTPNIVSMKKGAETAEPRKENFFISTPASAGVNIKKAALHK